MKNMRAAGNSAAKGRSIQSFVADNPIVFSGIGETTDTHLDTASKMPYLQHWPSHFTLHILLNVLFPLPLFAFSYSIILFKLSYVYHTTKTLSDNHNY